MDQTHCDCSSSEKIIKKPSLLGASIARYILATSLILKFPSLISFSKINDTVKVVNLFWPCSSPSPWLLVTCHSQCVFSNVLGNVLWLLSGTSILPELEGVFHLFAATHNSHPMVLGISAVLIAWVTVGTLSWALESNSFEIWILAPSMYLPLGYRMSFWLP